MSSSPPPPPPPSPGDEPDNDPHDASLLGRVVGAAEEAERLTGRHEETQEEVERALVIRVARIAGGFAVIGVGIAALPLPGPGWLIILVGLRLLPFVWAERTILLIRRRIPGVPESGTIPVTTWLAMGAIVVAFTTVSILWGNDIAQWLSDRWTALTD
ncbi:MAG TPA: PGPGW domain-containing protein [Microthrixaceae bacterium]|nr:PGPGW domain-containing protein [Microthrixaceae bacterium]